MLEDSAPFHPDHPNQPWSEKCVCGRVFMQPNSYALHVRTCKIMKQKLGKTLKEARERRAAGSAGSGDRGAQTISEPTEHGRRKRKCAWLDDEYLDVDVIAGPSTTPARGPQPMIPGGELGTHDGRLAPIGHCDDHVSDQAMGVAGPPLANANCLSPELGRGRRRAKNVTYKIKPNANSLPSSTLPASLNPPPQPPTDNTENSSPAETPPDKPVDVVPSTPGPPALVTTTTELNSFGLYKIYHSDPRDLPHDPDNSTLPGDLRENPASPIDPAPRPSTPSSTPSTPSSTPSSTPPSTHANLHPFPNLSCFRLGEWYWSDDSGKSMKSFHDLLSIVGSEEFNPSDVRAANWTKIGKLLAEPPTDDGDDMHLKEDGNDRHILWKSSTVTIDVPIRKGLKNSGSHKFSVPGFHHRPLVPLIKEKLQSSEGGEYFHTLGHELRWKPGEGKADSRVYGELYNSPTFIQAYEELQASPPEPNCHLPRHVVGLMFASDATMLASFGTAKLWPLYMYYANDSKHRRSKPSEKLFETVAYFEKLPDQFKDFVIEISGRETVAAALMTHCQREFFHGQWILLLDDEFLEAYCHGIVVTCYDGIKRRFYPRIFTYSADYPEKILLASIKNLGLFPCPRCKIPMKNVPAMGQKRDRHNRERLARQDNDARQKQVSTARKFIYEKKYAVTAEVVEAQLSDGSIVPSKNGFSHRLFAHGFDLFRMLVVDFMHEFELGVWKAIFIQLLRLLEATDKGLINTLDKRYRSMPTFGKDTIRRFVNNVSEMKQLAARDFEDLLQCAIPAFECLLPSPHNKVVMKLLFTLAEFHGLSKLRQHTDHTLAILDALTTKLGDQLRAFVKNTCTKFETKELTREYQARKRREARTERGQAPNKRRKTTSGQSASGRDLEESDPSNSRKAKTLNLHTYKFHSLGDIVPTIKMFGTTDSYSTQAPEGFHRHGKRQYKRTSKRNVSRQLSRIETRQARIRKLRKQLLPDTAEGYVDEEASQLPYFIGRSQNNPVNLPTFLQKKSGDPATKGFYSNLRMHLLPRLYQALLQEAEKPQSSEPQGSSRVQTLRALAKEAAESPNFFDDPQAQLDADQVYFHSERIYQHSLLHVNYTSYDVRRETDIINPKTTRRDVMCLRSLDEDESSNPHRFVHARVLGVYHTNVMYKGRGAADFRRRRFDFLFVRWFEFCEDSPSEGSLDRVELLPVSNPGGVGFLDPSMVLRASHIVPRYSLGQIHDSGSDPDRVVSHLARDSEDWEEYLINKFVDRDMLMRHYWGLGIGHDYSHEDAPTASDSIGITTAPMFEEDGMEDILASDSGDEGEDRSLSDDPDERPRMALDSDESDAEAEDNPEYTLDDLEAEELDLAVGLESDADSDWGGESDIQDAEDEGDDE